MAENFDQQELVPVTEDQQQQMQQNYQGGNNHHEDEEEDMMDQDSDENTAQDDKQEGQQHYILDNDMEQDDEQEQLNAVIESISCGKLQAVKKLQYQAFCAAISHEDHVRFVLNYLSNVQNQVSSKFATAKNRILAYRVSQMDPIQQKEVLAEGFDDDGEDGAGEKLLHLLQKMDIGNIMIIVCVWNNGVQIGTQQVRGGEFFRLIIERARELLKTIKEGVQNSELNEQRATNNATDFMPAPDKQQQRMVNQNTTPLRQPLNMAAVSTSPHIGIDLVDGQQNSSRIYVNQRSSEAADAQILKQFKESLGEQDMADATQEINESVKQLTKASIMELRAITKPNFMIEKTMQIVCALKGFKNLNWNTAKETLGKQSFKVELMQLNIQTLKSHDVLRAQQILTQKTNTMLTPENVQLHSEAAALLLIWSANVIKLYACFKKLGLSDGSDQKDAFKVDDLQRITNRTKIMLQNKQQDSQKETLSHLSKQKDVKTMSSPKKGEKSASKGQSIGHFVQNKQIVFNTNNDVLEPEAKTAKPTLVDINVIKKGINYPMSSSQKQAETEEINRERQIMQREEQSKLDQKNNLFSSSKAQDEKKNEQDNQKDDGTSKDASKKIDEEPEGKLKMNDVQSMPDDVDMIIGQLKNVDFGIQDLDVLIELSKQLKYKRIGLFPDTQYMLSLQNAGIPTEQAKQD